MCPRLTDSSFPEEEEEKQTKKW
uniref:Uncharacterized protein n=1 Tax=Rhizophora mucronata TaxID=61149 RepID=A0A2P2R5H6_RHIMU